MNLSGAGAFDLGLFFKLGNDRELFYVTANVEYDLNDAWSLTSLSSSPGSQR